MKNLQKIENICQQNWDYFNLNKEFPGNYLTNKSFSVEHSEASQVSFESSSSPLPNQFSVERTALAAWACVRLRRESLGTAPRVGAFELVEDEAPGALLPEGPEAEFLRRKPSMAEPITVASTIVPFV